MPQKLGGVRKTECLSTSFSLHTLLYEGYSVMLKKQHYNRKFIVLKQLYKLRKYTYNKTAQVVSTSQELLIIKLF